VEQAGAAARAGAGVGESGARRGGEPWIGGVLLVSAVASGVGGRAMLAAGGAVVATSVRVGSRPVVNPASVAVAVWLRRSLHLGTLQSQARRSQHALRPPAVPQ